MSEIPIATYFHIAIHTFVWKHNGMHTTESSQFIGTASPLPDEFRRNSVRKIIHVDMDMFYAAVEILDNPSLKNLPIVVGGSPTSRSVVCTASYAARKFGVRSAMACSVAQRLCPQAIFLPPRFERYQEISRKIREIFQRYTDKIEPLSLDEAYLDVTDSTLGLYASQIARHIKEDILRELGLTCSAGVGPNKLIAKIASDFKKPNGLVVVTPDQALEFMRPLPVRKIHGIGPATEARLAAVGIKTCADILAMSREELDQKLGRLGGWMWHAARGEDSRPVETHYDRKSFGREDTFEKDETDLGRIESRLKDLSESVCASMDKRGVKGRTITLKVKYFDFESITRSRTIKDMTVDPDIVMATAMDLLKTKTAVGQRPIRLIGVSLSHLDQTTPLILTQSRVESMSSTPSTSSS